MTVFIAGGGTGGHLTPAVALAAEFTRRDVTPVLIVGSRDSGMLPDGIRYRTLIVRARYGIIGKMRHAAELGISFLQSVSYILRERPKAVIGVGGYLSVPPLLAGLVFRIPLFICEQNSIPGKANRFLAVFAKGFYHSFNKSMEYIGKGMVAGNPVRAEFYRMTKSRARKELSLPKNARVLLVTGGSQGARRLNEIFLDAYPLIAKKEKQLHTLWVTGKGNYEAIADAIASRGLKGISLFAFHAKMHLLVHAADLALARSGSSTVNEFMASSLPALFVPFPHATDDHQYYNAKEMADAGAAEILREESLTAPELAHALSALMKRWRSRHTAHANAARTIAARTIADDVLSALTGR